MQVYFSGVYPASKETTLAAPKRICSKIIRLTETLEKEMKPGLAKVLFSTLAYDKFSNIAMEKPHLNRDKVPLL